MINHLRAPLRALACAALLATAMPGMAASTALADDEERASPVATSPYLCTPSGFGQKARCYLRHTFDDA